MNVSTMLLETVLEMTGKESLDDINKLHQEIDNLMDVERQLSFDPWATWSWDN